MRRDARHLRAELIHSADILVVLRQSSVDAAHLGRQRGIFEPPAEEFGVKLLGRVLIARSEFEPAEIACGVLHLSAHGIFSLGYFVNGYGQGEGILSQVTRRLKWGQKIFFCPKFRPLLSIQLMSHAARFNLAFTFV